MKKTVIRKLEIGTYKSLEKALYKKAKKIVEESPHKDNIGHNIENNINQTIKGLIGEYLFIKNIGWVLVNQENPYYPYDAYFNNTNIDIKTIFIGKKQYEKFMSDKIYNYWFQVKQLQAKMSLNVTYAIVILAPWNWKCFILYNDFFTTSNIVNYYPEVLASYGKGKILNREANLKDYLKDFDYIKQKFIKHEV